VKENSERLVGGLFALFVHDFAASSSLLLSQVCLLHFAHSFAWTPRPADISPRVQQGPVSVTVRPLSQLRRQDLIFPSVIHEETWVVH